MKRRRKTSADVDRGKYREQIQAWRKHPHDPWAELERMGLTEIVVQLGWSQPRVSRTMNSVASEERFRLKLQRAIELESDRPLYLRGGSQGPGSPVDDHGYTHDASHNLDPDAEIIDLPTLTRIQDESAAKREERIGELIAACEEIRAAVDERVRRNPDFMRLAGRHVWLLRSKIDAMHRDLKRKAA